MAEKNTKKIEKIEIEKRKFIWSDLKKDEFWAETESIRDIFIKKEKEKYGNGVCECGGSV
ncbi:MAG: hypothetical protein L7H18_04060 [Candidatus Nealsonbacteria bacterium DGGOD1a]|nr:MAG: hypothetical protein L7H18_04060 [Candidatus Nealsonbacteria bacterium DGGOD1a]